MKRAFVLVTAMPPTKGHLHLIQFASELAPTEVIVNTQPDEPFAEERVQAIIEATAQLNNVHVNRIHKFLPQEPEGREGFWDMWTGFLRMFGFKQGDYLVASEMYGRQLAEFAGGIFIPYDLERSIYAAKATKVRNDPRTYFDSVLPEFQPYIRRRVTVFGAESVGKTTLSRQLAAASNGHWLFEWARPYLENCGNVVDIRTMTAIWHGQYALQASAEYLMDKPFIIQDTDLFSTWGYWDQYSASNQLGPIPYDLRTDALETASDFYIVLKSNIPFTPDPLRYGGSEREFSDDFWVSVLQTMNLKYGIVHSSDPDERLREAQALLNDFYDRSVGLHYDRVTA